MICVIYCNWGEFLKGKIFILSPFSMTWEHQSYVWCHSKVAITVEARFEIRYYCGHIRRSNDRSRAVWRVLWQLDSVILQTETTAEYLLPYVDYLGELLFYAIFTYLGWISERGAHSRPRSVHLLLFPLVMSFLLWTLLFVAVQVMAESLGCALRQGELYVSLVRN